MSYSKRWFITITGSNSEKAISISLGRKASIALLSIISVFVCSVFVFAGIGVKKQIDLNKISTLEKHNTVLQDHLTLVGTSMDSIKTQLQKMETWEDEIRAEKSLKKIKEAVRLQGTGGLFYIDSLYMDLPDTLSAKLVSLIRYKESLERRVAFDLESHLGVFATLNERAEIYEYTPSIYPTFGRISDPYGWRRHPVTKRRTFHHGIDFSNRVGSPIYATANGTIKKTGRLRNFGRYIVINHKYGYKTKYAHLQKILVKTGDTVKKGQIIALMGNTGRSTGSHLHYEVHHFNRYKNPYSYFYKEPEDIIAINER